MIGCIFFTAGLLDATVAKFSSLFLLVKSKLMEIKCGYRAVLNPDTPCLEYRPNSGVGGNCPPGTCSLDSRLPRLKGRGG